MMATEFFPIANRNLFLDHCGMTEDPFIAGLRAFFAANPKVKPAAVGRAVGLSDSAIRKMMTAGVKTPKRDNAEKIASEIGMTVEEVISLAEGGEAPKRDAIAVPGFVGAGAEVYLSDPYPKGEGMYKVTCPPQLSPHGIVAVEVRGESMEPVFSEGDLLFYTRNGDHGVPSEAIGRRCVAETEDGKVWVKQLKIGTAPGLFNLLSINPAATNMLDVRVKWAAPVRLHLPKEFVKRVE